MTTEISRETSATDALVYGRVTVGTSPQPLCEPLTTDRTGLFRGVMIVNMSDSTIYVGNQLVSVSTGFPIVAGNFIELPIDRPDKIFLVASDTDLQAAWIGL